jgi:hypothetical protein
VEKTYPTRFTTNSGQTRRKPMEWIVAKQIAVEAETPEEAVQKLNEGKTISFTVSLRPKPQQQSQPRTGIPLPTVPTNMRTGQPL